MDSAYVSDCWLLEGGGLKIALCGDDKVLVRERESHAAHTLTLQSCQRLPSRRYEPTRLASQPAQFNNPPATVLASRASGYHLDTQKSQKSPFRTPKNCCEEFLKNVNFKHVIGLFPPQYNSYMTLFEDIIRYNMV